MQKIIPDTNFLIYLAKYKMLDKIEDYKILLLKQVLEELIFLSKSKKVKVKDRESSELVLAFMEKIKDKVEYFKHVNGKADDAVLKLAIEEKCFVGTMDKVLIKRLKKEKKKILIIRQKKFIEELG